MSIRSLYRMREREREVRPGVKLAPIAAIREGATPSMTSLQPPLAAAIIHNQQPVDPDASNGTSFFGRNGQYSKEVVSSFTMDEYHKLLSLVRTSSASINFAGNICSPHLPWIIDSGASRHICADSSLLQKPTNCQVPINLPNGHTITVDQSGEVKLPPFTLENSLHIPSFKVNLLSVSQLTKALNCSVTFFPTHCVLQDLVSRTTIGQGKEREGIYELDPVTSSTSCFTVSSSQNLWHRRGNEAPEEYVETEYYKDLNCVDKQHHTTGTGFIKVDKNGGTFNLMPDVYESDHHDSCKGNPATNEWIPSMEPVFPVSHKPKRSEN